MGNHWADSWSVQAASASAGRSAHEAHREARVSTDLVIAKLDAARLTLYEATTIPEAKRFVDIGVTAETWAQKNSRIA